MAQGTAGQTILSNQVSFLPGVNLDAGGRLRVSNLTSCGEYKILNNTFPSVLLEETGTGTFTNNTNRVTMSVTSGQYSIITSKKYHPYFNGKSQLVELTIAGFGAATNVEKSIGYISSNSAATFNSSLDGFRLFKDTSDVYYFQVWRNGTNTINVARSSWFDKLDGTGPSGMTINWSNFNVFMWDFLYLGGTALRLFVMYNGSWQLVHQYNYANSDTAPIFLSPNKPIRYEIRSTTGSGNMDFICGAVFSEGDVSKGTTTAIEGLDAGITPLLTGNAYALCGVRKSQTFRDIFAFVNSFEGIVSTNDFVNLELRLNPTVAGTFTYSAISNTSLESATGAITNTVTGGIDVANTYMSLNMNNAKQVHSLFSELNSSLTNTMDAIVLCATPILASTNIRVTGSMQVEWFNQ